MKTKVMWKLITYWELLMIYPFCDSYGGSQVHSPFPFATVFVPGLSLIYYLICENLLSVCYAWLIATYLMTKMQGTAKMTCPWKTVLEMPCQMVIAALSHGIRLVAPLLRMKHFCVPVGRRVYQDEYQPALNLIRFRSTTTYTDELQVESLSYFITSNFRKYLCLFVGYFCYTVEAADHSNSWHKTSAV
jgi:hypothetical protein